MTRPPALLEHLESAVFLQDEGLFQRAMENAINGNLAPARFRAALLNGLDRVRKKILSNDASLPELLISLDMTTAGLKRLRSLETDSGTAADSVSLVIGVVAGDPHDLGKNIISAIYASFGYQVVDLGAQVETQRFVQTVRETNARVLALSAMMSTTMALMPEIIGDVKSASPRTLVMVGGAPLDAELARKYGADGYAESAVTVLEKTRQMLEGPGRST